MLLKNYIQVSIQVKDKNLSDLITALMYGENFDGFWEEKDQLHAFIPEELWNKTRFENLIIKPFDLTYSFQRIEEKNWNKAWEESFQPVWIDKKIYIRAGFHPPSPDHDVLEIIIDPKMSFGTGHHETTSLMIRLMLEENWEDKTVIDMGSGTGILAILAEKLGAREIFAVDVDSWAFQNMKENISANRTFHIKPIHGDALKLTDLPEVDIFLANINRNILLNDMKHYVKKITDGGLLFLSGILDNDVPLIEKEALRLGLKPIKQIGENGWAAIKFGL